MGYHFVYVAHIHHIITQFSFILSFTPPEHDNIAVRVVDTQAPFIHPIIKALSVSLVNNKLSVVI